MVPVSVVSAVKRTTVYVEFPAAVTVMGLANVAPAAANSSWLACDVEPAMEMAFVQGGEGHHGDDDDQAQVKKDGFGPGHPPFLMDGRHPHRQTHESGPDLGDKAAAGNHFGVVPAFPGQIPAGVLEGEGALDRQGQPHDGGEGGIGDQGHVGGHPDILLPIHQHQHHNAK